MPLVSAVTAAVFADEFVIEKVCVQVDVVQYLEASLSGAADVFVIPPIPVVPLL